MQSHLLSVIIFLPLLGLPALLMLRSDDHTWIRRIALAVSLAEFIISLAFLLPTFDSAIPGYQFVENHRWIGDMIRYHIGVDGISLFLVLLTTFLTPLAILCSWNSIHEYVKGFFVALLVIETAMIGVFVSLDLFLFFVFWEMTLIPMYFLVGIWGHTRRIYAAVKFILYTMFGSILMLVAILWLYNLSSGASGAVRTFDLVELVGRLQRGDIVIPAHTELWLFGAFFLAFAIKVPLFPLHTWLPDAHTEAPTAGSVILAGVMLKLGTYGMMRFCLPLFPDSAHRMAPLIGVLAIIGIVYGALVATIQPNFKRLIAYTSVSHLGFVVLGIFSFTTISFQGAIFQMISHGVSTGALFLGLGMIYDRRHTYEIKEFGGLVNPMPVLMSFFLFVCLWSYQRVALGELSNEKNRTLPDASGRERLILVTVALAIVFMGVASPLFTRRMQTSTDTLVQQTKGLQRNDATRPPGPAPALAAGQTMLLAPPQPLHDRSLASTAPRTVQP
jgi:NADH-quinone oxidoreductase subunit M